MCPLVSLCKMRWEDTVLGTPARKYSNIQVSEITRVCFAEKYYKIYLTMSYLVTTRQNEQALLRSLFQDFKMIQNYDTIHRKRVI